MEGILWKASVPGLSHASPVVWEDRIFLVTAVDEEASGTVELDVQSGRRVFENQSVHSFRVLCLDRKTGRLLWDRSAYRGVPRIKRHVKGTHANATPATDGKRLLAFFGSHGLLCYDFEGNLLWKKDFPVLDAGYVGKAQYQWGTASSPTIFEDLVIVQCDSRRDSFLAAYKLADGSLAWKVSRNENPSWSTPVVYRGEPRVELITNSPRYLRGYDPRTGNELWRFLDGADVKVPSPVVGDGLIYFSGGAPRGRRFLALRPGGAGDISSNQAASSASRLAWEVPRGGPYTPTPLLYRGCLYILTDNGVLSCFDPDSGDLVYRHRVPERGGNYSASPVAADGRVYLSSQEGEIQVVKAGPAFEPLSSNPMGEPLMATPALSGDSVYVRGRHHLFAVSRPD